MTLSTKEKMLLAMPKTVQELASVLGVSKTLVKRNIKLMREEKLCHIIDWVRSPRAVNPIHSRGEGIDAPRPSYVTHRQWYDAQMALPGRGKVGDYYERKNSKKREARALKNKQDAAKKEAIFNSWLSTLSPRKTRKTKAVTEWQNRELV